MIWHKQRELKKSPSKWALKLLLSTRTHPVEISSINAILRSYDVILVGGHRNAGSHHETLVTRPQGSTKETKTDQLKRAHPKTEANGTDSTHFFSLCRAESMDLGVFPPSLSTELKKNK